MKITDRFIGDHKTFRKMMADVESIAKAGTAPEQRAKLLRLAELLKDHLIIHAWFEDNFYYPAVRETFRDQKMLPLTEVYMAQLEKEHKVIDNALLRLERELKAEPVSPAWPQIFAVFSYALQSHMRKEEDELFPASEKLLGASGLERLSAEMERHRAQAPRPAPRVKPEVA